MLSSIFYYHLLIIGLCEESNDKTSGCHPKVAPSLVKACCAEREFKGKAIPLCNADILLSYLFLRSTEKNIDIFRMNRGLPF